MRTLTIFKKKIFNYKFFQINLKNIALIEKKLNNDRLDIEFCIKNRKIFILQSRPLKKIPKTKDQLIEDSLVNITKKIKKLSDFKHDLSGKKTIFSNMSDWNPAEMIGEKPNSLAISLYKNLITNYIWSKQRYNYGYKNCKSNVLMFDFLEHLI